MSGYPTKETRVFVASSSKSIGVAEALKRCLTDQEIEVVPWKELGVFLLSEHTIESLERAANRCQFAVFILGQDDVIKRETGEHYIPRDNVVFELGLFLGRIGRKRSYMLKPQGVDIRLPTDLRGVTWAEFTLPGTKVSDLREAAQQIRHAMLQAPMTPTEPILSTTVMPTIVIRHCLNAFRDFLSSSIPFLGKPKFRCDAQITICSHDGRIMRHPHLSSLGHSTTIHKGKVLWSTFQHSITDLPFNVLISNPNKNGWVVWTDSGYSELYSPISSRDNDRLCIGYSNWTKKIVYILEIHQEFSSKLEESALERLGQILGKRIKLIESE